MVEYGLYPLLSLDVSHPGTYDVQELVEVYWLLPVVEVGNE